MNVKKLFLATVVGFIGVVFFEMLWHGMLMKGMYDATSSLWRPQEQFYMNFMFGGQFLFALAMAFVYSRLGNHLTCKHGLEFGFYIGLISAMPDLGAYSYLPIPLSICLMWMLASMLKSLIVGVAVAKVYKFS